MGKNMTKILRLLVCTVPGIFLVTETVARPGSVTTLDGRKLHGEIEFTNQVIQIRSNGLAAQSIAFAELKTLKFESETDAPGNGPVGKGNGLLGYYFGSTNFDGSPFVRLDESVNFDWGAREPAPGVQKDFFSVIWMGEVEAPATGDFTFHVTADDWGRLTVGTNPVVEASLASGLSESTGKIHLESGRRYPIELRYSDLFSAARARLFWSTTNMAKTAIPKDRLYAGSILDEHKTGIDRQNGLLATYYAKPDFAGRTFTRVEPGIDLNFSGVNLPPGISNSFSVRWSGQVRAEHAETYTFHALADEGVRLWVNDRLLINEWSQFGYSEYRQDMLLEAGEWYDVMLETRNNSGTAIARLIWSSPSTAKVLVPATHLLPSRSAMPRGQSREERSPAGVLLRNGTFLAGPVERATESSLRMTGFFSNNPISTLNVARIHLQPLAKSSLSRLQPGRTGVLLAKGDFMECEFRGLSDGQVQVTSILFGTRKYDAKKDVLALVLRELSSTRASFEIQLLDRSRLLAASVELRGEDLLVQDATFGAVSIPMSLVAEIKRDAEAGG